MKRIGWLLIALCLLMPQNIVQGEEIDTNNSTDATSMDTLELEESATTTIDSESEEFTLNSSDVSGSIEVTEEASDTLTDTAESSVRTKRSITKSTADYGQEITPEKKRIYKNNWDFWDQPYIAGAQSIANTRDYYEKEVVIKRRGTTATATYVLVYVNTSQGEQMLGWLNEKGVGPTDPLYSENGKLIENTYKYVVKNNWDVWDKPYVSGAKSVAKTNPYLNEKILITRIAKTDSGTYAKIWVHRNNKYNFLGWYNQNGLSNNISDLNKISGSMSGESIPNTYGQIVKNNWDIWKEPYRQGTQSVANTSNYRNTTILFTRRAKTNSGTYYKMWARVNGKFTYIGWINYTGTTLADKVLSNTSVSMPMKRVSKKNWTIWKDPYVYGTKSVGNTNSYYGKDVQIIAEAQTNYGKYYKIKYLGKQVGWVNTGGFKNLSEYIIPIAWENQINTVGYAPSGCAATSINSNLHAKNYAMNRNLSWFYHNLPLHTSNPDLGQIGHPLGYTPFQAVISPVGATNFMRSLGGNVENITGKSLSYLKDELKKGNAVMFWGRAGLSDGATSTTTHVMTFIGYKNGYFLVQDPAYSTLGMGRRWFSESRVNNYLAVKGRKMVVTR